MFEARSRFRILAVTAVGVMALAIGGCDDGGQTERAVAQWRARQARIDPPQLWSVQVLGEAHSGRPVLICADQRVRSGFTSVIPAVGQVHCARETAPAPAPSRPSSTYRCRLGGVEYAVSSTVTGERAHDFEVGSAIFRTDGEQVYARTLRFRRLGHCPAGWNVGDTTNQRGQRLSSAVELP